MKSAVRNYRTAVVITGLFSAVAAGLMLTAAPACAVPTSAEQIEFAEEVYDQGILNEYSFPPGLLGEELVGMCRMAIEYPQVGLTEDDIVSVFMNVPAYGFSAEEAEWFVRTGLDKCD